MLRPAASHMAETLDRVNTGRLRAKRSLRTSLCLQRSMKPMACLGLAAGPTGQDREPVERSLLRVPRYFTVFPKREDRLNTMLDWKYRFSFGPTNRYFLAIPHSVRPLSLFALACLFIAAALSAYFRPSRSAFQTDRGRYFSVIANGVSD